MSISDRRRNGARGAGVFDHTTAYFHPSVADEQIGLYQKHGGIITCTPSVTRPDLVFQVDGDPADDG